MSGRAAVLVCTALLAGAALLPATSLADDDVGSRAQLNAWLANHPHSPLDALSPGARERFLASVSFGPGGIEYFDASDLMDELDDGQIRAVLAIFGSRALDVAPPSHEVETRRFEKLVRNPGVIGPIEHDYNDWYRSTLARDATDLQRTALLATEFDARLAARFDPKALRAADDHELRLLRSAARRVALATTLPRHVDAFRAVFDERRRRERLSSDDVATLRNLLLASRRIAEARRVAHDFPMAELPPLPKFEDTLPAGGVAPTVWVLSTDGKTLTREIAVLAPVEMAVIVSAGESREWARSIQADPALSQVFERTARWLVAAPGIESIQDVRSWNREFAHARVAMIYDRSGWALLPDWTVPHIYILRDGRVVESLREFDVATLAAALQRHGLLP